MNKTRGALYIGIVALILAGAVFWHFDGEKITSALLVFRPTSTGSSSPAVDATSTSGTTSPDVPDTAPNDSAFSATITPTEVIAITNTERSENADLPPLTENADLDAAAETKLQDMFAEQYFAHVSPNGTGPGTLAEQAGYDYVVEGENLAEGNFKDAQDLLDAWMASPGHRANILNTRYTNIGVAVGKGVYDGQNVWMAVQEFGKPLSSCPAVDTGLHDAIASNQTKAAQLSSQLDSIKQALIATATGTPDENTTYNQIADHYNENVDLYNGVVTRLKAEIATYNQEVDAFNACVNG